MLTMFNTVLLCASISGILLGWQSLWILTAAYLILIYSRTRRLKTADIEFEDRYLTGIAPFWTILEHVSHNLALMTLVLLAGRMASDGMVTLIAAVAVSVAFLVALPFGNIALFLISRRNS
jgi:hypothetical protein